MKRSAQHEDLGFRCWGCRKPLSDFEMVAINFGTRGKIRTFHLGCLHDHLTRYYGILGKLVEPGDPTTEDEDESR